ncbi:hypothetical protein [Bartonella sp. AU55XJBT]|uniref:hypothetical protein n=1 Tax=Bartonella sp. AU55XJBT TaxID=3019091 RepID=UPI00235E4332|nr:hypothetical protein [Bartonella sp. AU55XJBT]
MWQMFFWTREKAFGAGNAGDIFCGTVRRFLVRGMRARGLNGAVSGGSFLKVQMR